MSHDAVVTARSERLLAVCAVLCVLHAFDLGFTQAQLARGNFAELNGLAAACADGPVGVCLYKCGMFGVGLGLLLIARRHWQAECGAWLLLAVSVGLMIWWQFYLALVEHCLNDPAVSGPLVAF